MEAAQADHAHRAIEPLEFTIITLPPLKALGRSHRVQSHPSTESTLGNPIPRLWADSFREGILMRLQEHPWRRFPDTLVGWVGDSRADGSHRYVAGILVDADAWVLDTCTIGDIPGGEYGRLTVRGREPEILFDGQHLLDRHIRNAGRSAHSLLIRMEWYGPRYFENTSVRLVHLLRLLAPEDLGASCHGENPAQRSP